jgi:hypothetical protein
MFEKQTPYYWQFIPLMKSGTIRAVLVGLVSWLLSSLGVAEAVAGADAGRWVDLGLQLVEGSAFVWAAVSRYRMPTPPLALTADHAREMNARHLSGLNDLKATEVSK